MTAADRQGGAVLDSAGEKLRQVLKQLDTARDTQSAAEITESTRELIRASLAENQDLIRDLQERLRLRSEESESQAKRRAELEKTLSKRESQYEELLGALDSR